MHHHCIVHVVFILILRYLGNTILKPNGQNHVLTQISQEKKKGFLCFYSSCEHIMLPNTMKIINHI